MNNRYLYRAKRIDNGEWVEGFIGIHTFVPPEESGKETYLGTVIEKVPERIYDCESYEVDPFTVCQCTGLKGIYEHDIFECDGEIYEIVFDQDDLVWWADGYGHQYIQLGEFKPDEFNVIGNAIDNQELLEVEE